MGPRGIRLASLSSLSSGIMNGFLSQISSFVSYKLSVFCVCNGSRNGIVTKKTQKLLTLDLWRYIPAKIQVLVCNIDALN